MKRNRIRWIIVLGTLSMLGIAIAQAYWVNKAFNITEKELDQTLHVALFSVAKDMAQLNDHQLNPNPVSQLSGNYYVVALNDKIDANILEHYLNQEFQKQNLVLDYEYAIYDCSSDEMVYGNYVGREDHKSLGKSLPKWEDNIYYFGVRFPDRESHVFRELRFWFISSILIVVMLLVFAYSLFIILKQKKLSEVQKDFVNTMTHEFKTPLSTIAISANVLANSEVLKKEDRLVKYTGIVQEENARLQRQVDKLLQMTDLEKDRIVLKKEPIDVHELMSQIASHLDLRIKENNGQLNLNLTASDPIVFADKLHLTNIIYNLLDNAIKYSPKSPEISLETHRNGEMHLMVKDNGKGIASEEQKRIFQKFYRVSTGDVHDVKGFGLGLSYVQKIIKEHGWKIELESELKKGSTFIIKINNHA
ncbi:MAG: HAMP domain-containing histidine kinase [Schleiferiaceae bacterium]|jgi:two-component system phosphate regulon sensor histidine kinase PhoR|nr:HAMP domain-containing histidine kinase [Schleiferiaceae bacterium]